MPTGTHAVKALDEHALGVHIGEAQGTGQVFHSLAFAPAGHSVDEGVNDLGIIDEVDVAETCLFLARALVAHVVDDAGDASHGFAVAIGHVVNGLAEVKCRVLVGPQRVQLVGDQRGYKILAVAIQRVDGEVHKLEQIALGGLEFSYFYSHFFTVYLLYLKPKA